MFTRLFMIKQRHLDDGCSGWGRINNTSSSSSSSVTCGTAHHSFHTDRSDKVEVFFSLTGEWKRRKTDIYINKYRSVFSLQDVAATETHLFSPVHIPSSSQWPSFSFVFLSYNRRLRKPSFSGKRAPLCWFLWSSATRTSGCSDSSSSLKQRWAQFFKQPTFTEPALLLLLLLSKMFNFFMN